MLYIAKISWISYFWHCSLAHRRRAFFADSLNLVCRVPLLLDDELSMVEQESILAKDSMEDCLELNARELASSSIWNQIYYNAFTPSEAHSGYYYICLLFKRPGRVHVLMLSSFPSTHKYLLINRLKNGLAMELVLLLHQYMCSLIIQS